MESQSLPVAPSSNAPEMQPIGIPEKPANRRRHPRYACEGRAEVCVPHGGLLFRGKVLDLSFSGCFVETVALNLERGTPVEIFFVARQLQFRIAGRIAVLYPKKGAGIAFDPLGPRRTREISDLIAELKAASQPPRPSFQA
ncbi:MAG: PilZ domain-containing protein [Acidobacteriaceae bacterium]